MQEILGQVFQMYHTVKNSLADGKISAAEAKQIAREACGLVLLLLGGDDSPQTKRLAAAVQDWSDAAERKTA